MLAVFTCRTIIGRDTGSAYMRMLLPNKAAAPNRRPRFAFAALLEFAYSFCAPPSFLAAVGEPQR